MCDRHPLLLRALPRCASLAWLLFAAATCSSSGTGKRSDASASEGESGGSMAGLGASAGSGGVRGGGSVTTGISCAGEVRTPVAGTYFVDFDSGSDSNDGGTQASAWKHAPGDAAATGTASSVLLKPGDVVLFKGDVWRPTSAPSSCSPSGSYKDVPA